MREIRRLEKIHDFTTTKKPWRSKRNIRKLKSPMQFFDHDETTNGCEGAKASASAGSDLGAYHDRFQSMPGEFQRS